MIEIRRGRFWLYARPFTQTIFVAVAIVAASCTDNEALDMSTSAGGESGTIGGSGGFGAAGTTGTSGNAGTSGNPGQGGGGAGGSALCGPATGSGTFNKAKAIATGSPFASPFDATPSPDGCTVYVTALDMMTGRGAVFSIPTNGGALTPVAVGAPLMAPVGITISSDGKTLFIADIASKEGKGGNGLELDGGAIYSVAASGGTPTAIMGSLGTVPRGVTIAQEQAGDTLYFTGINPTSGKAGVFKLATSGGAVTPVTEGAPFVDPNGITITSKGDIYVADTVASGSRAAMVIQIKGGASTALPVPLTVGFPAGIAISKDDASLVVSGLTTSAGQDVLRKITTVDQKITSFQTGITTFNEPAGLHRALNAEVYAWVDSTANGTGNVFVLANTQ